MNLVLFLKQTAVYPFGNGCAHLKSQCAHLEVAVPIWKSQCAHLHLILFLTQTALCPFENGCAHLKNLVCPFGENGNAQFECPNQCAHLTFSVVFNTNRKWAHCNGHCPGHCNGHCPRHCNGHCSHLCLGHCNGHDLVATRRVLRKRRAVAAGLCPLRRPTRHNYALPHAASVNSSRPPAVSDMPPALWSPMPPQGSRGSMVLHRASWG